MLILEKHTDSVIGIGKMGAIEFKEGFYAYVGSALSGLEQRVGRHLRVTRKKLHWHIDYFMASPDVEVREVVFAETVKRKECEIAANLQLKSIKNFGCSDCACKSHLFFSTSLKELKGEVYSSFHLVVEHFRATKIKPV